MVLLKLFSRANLGMRIELVLGSYSNIKRRILYEIERV